jgi:hypothetical protein
MAGGDAKPRPFRDAGAARRLGTTEIAEHCGEKMRPCGGKQALIADDLVVTQQDMMDGVLVIELIALKPVGSAKIFPTLLLDENVVAHAKGAIQEVAVLIEIPSVDDDEHVSLLQLLIGVQEFREIAPLSYGNK